MKRWIPIALALPDTRPPRKKGWAGIGDPGSSGYKPTVVRGVASI